MGSGKNHVEFVTQGFGRAVRAVAKLVEDVPAGGLGEELEGREGTALASQTKEGDGGECGEKAEVDRGTIYKSQKSLAVYVHVVQAEIGVQTGGGGGCWGGVEDALAPQIGDGRS